MAAHTKGLVARLMLFFYAAIPLASIFLFMRSDKAVNAALFDIGLSLIPMVITLRFTWRLVWPRWKLYAKLLLHPFIYLLLFTYINHWVILVAWLHQGVLGLGGHIWFSHRHGFKWYAIEDPNRYMTLSRQAMGVREGEEN
jgi:hypothetical protein